METIKRVSRAEAPNKGIMALVEKTLRDKQSTQVYRTDKGFVCLDKPLLGIRKFTEYSKRLVFWAQNPEVWSASNAGTGLEVLLTHSTKEIYRKYRDFIVAQTTAQLDYVNGNGNTGDIIITQLVDGYLIPRYLVDVKLGTNHDEKPGFNKTLNLPVSKLIAARIFPDISQTLLDFARSDDPKSFAAGLAADYGEAIRSVIEFRTPARL